MRTFLDNRLKQLKDFFGKMQRKDKLRLTILAVVVVALAVTAVILLGRTRYETLYVAETPAEAGAVMQALRDMGEQAEIEGTRVLVPEGRANELRADLAYQGVTGVDDIDLSIIMQAGSFNTTEAQAKKIYDADKEAKIRRQLLKNNKIVSAIPTVNSGEYSPFVISDGVREATAAIMLQLRDGATLTKAEIQSIVGLVKSSIPGIKDENISITDNMLTPYNLTETEAGININDELNARLEMENMLSQRMKTQAEQLLMPTFGVNGVEVIVSVRLNFDKRVTESVEFDPPVPGEEDGIVRSSSELVEMQRAEGDAEGVVGTDPNGMGTVEYPYGVLDDDGIYTRILNEKNYEINETKKLIEHEQGTVEWLSVAVSLDSLATREDYTGYVTDLVSKGLGIPVENVSVQRMEFSYHTELAQRQADKEAAEVIAQRKETVEMVLMWAVILLLGLAFISLIKAIVRAIKPPPPEEPLLADGDYIYHEGVNYVADEDLSEIERIEDIELHTKSSGLEQIERFIDKDPASVAQLLRNWLTDE